MSISGHSSQEGAEKASGLIQLPYPNPYRPETGDSDSVLAQLERELAQTDPQMIAGCFIEPIMSDGGLIVPPPGFLQGLAAICARHGILTICDEVKVGLARSGKLHCFEHEGFRPDILVLGKGLGGGLPLSAVIGPAEIMDCATSFAMQTLHGEVRAFPGEDARLRLVSAVLVETDEKWASDTRICLKWRYQDT